MSKGNAVLINDEFQYHPNGDMIFECRYKNCKQPQKQGWETCDKHCNVGYPELEKYQRNQNLLKFLGVN